MFDFGASDKALIERSPVIRLQPLARLPRRWLVGTDLYIAIPALRAVKVRGREYLRIIYGPEYTLPEHLERLRDEVLAPNDSCTSL